MATIVAIQNVELLIVGIVLAGAVAIATKPLGRFVIFAGGIMTLFQSASISLTVRGAFLATVIVATVPAVLSIGRRSRELGIDVRRFLWPSALLLTLIVGYTLVLSISPRPVDDWLRDATGYILLLVSPAFALDAGLHARRRTIELITLVVGMVGAFSFLVAWLSRRGVPLAGLEQFALASSLLTFPSITMCMILFYKRSGRARLLWGSAALVQVGMLCASGGRTAIIYCVALVGLFVLVGGLIGPWFSRTLLLAGLSIAVGAALVSLTVTFGISEFLIGRYDWFENVSVEAVQSDQSGQARLFAYAFMWNAFLETPFWGSGFGRTYPSVTTHVVTPGIYTLDTPFVYLAKFGAIGTALLLVSTVGVLRAGVTLGDPSRQTRREMGVLLSGSVVVWVAMLAGGAPHDQKGFSVQIALLIALMTAWVVDDLSGRAGATPAVSPHGSLVGDAKPTGRHSTAQVSSRRRNFSPLGSPRA